jgi:YVTN family beta-propeller protein
MYLHRASLNGVTHRISSREPVELNYNNGSVPNSSSLEAGVSPSDISVNPNTNLVYVANEDSNTVSVIDGNNNTIVSEVTVGTSPIDISANPNTNLVYVANEDSNTVSVMDGKTNKKVKDILLSDDSLVFSNSDSPVALDLNPITNMLYVANYAESVFVINATTNTVTKKIDFIEDFISDLKVNPNTNTIYLASGFDNIIYAINTTTNQIVKEVKVAGAPYSLAVNLETNIVYAANIDSNRISVIDGTTGILLKSIIIGAYPPEKQGYPALAVNPKTNTV